MSSKTLSEGDKENPDYTNGINPIFASTLKANNLTNGPVKSLEGELTNENINPNEINNVKTNFNDPSDSNLVTQLAVQTLVDSQILQL